MKFSRWIFVVQCLCLTTKTVWSKPDKEALCEKKCKDCGKGKKCVCNKEGASNTGVSNPAFCLNETDQENDESNSGSSSEDATSKQEQEAVIFEAERLGPCDNSPCQNGGTCVPRGKKYKCRCASGYNPKEDCQPCKDSFGDKCRHKCYYCDPKFGCDPVTGCKKCLNGFKNSEKRVNDCKKIDCKRNPCLNGGECETHVGFALCFCPIGYTGNFCEAKIKISHKRCTEKLRKTVCKNGASCYVKSNFTVRCLCPLPYAGQFCDKSCKPASQNCVHGSCERLPGSDKKKKKCVCHSGWKEDYCDVACDPGKWGPACSENCGRCVEKPCDHIDGMCPPGGCLDNFKGDNCDTSPNETENYFAAQDDLAPGRKAKFLGRLRILGLFPKSSFKYKHLKEDTEMFVENSTRQTFRQSSQQAGPIRAFAELSPGSVIVDFSLFVPRELVSGRTNIERDMVKGLRNDAQNFRSSVGNYSVDRSSIKVTSVSSSEADTSDHFLVILLAICSIAGLLALSLAMIAWKVHRHRKMAHRHPKMAIAGSFRATNTH